MLGEHIGKPGGVNPMKVTAEYWRKHWFDPCECQMRGSALFHKLLSKREQ